MKKIKFVLAIVTMMTAGIFGFVKTAHAEDAGKTAKKVAVMQASAAPAPVTAAQTPQPKSGGAFSKINVADLLATLIYSLLGLVIALFGYKVYDWITPFDLRKELEIDQNTSLGIVAGSIILGLCIIVAAAIMSP